MQAKPCPECHGTTTYVLRAKTNTTTLLPGARLCPSCGAIFRVDPGDGSVEVAEFEPAGEVPEAWREAYDVDEGA